MNAATQTLTRCLVCGFTEVRTDEVIDRGIVLLAECPRCQHLWTVRPAATGRRSVPGRAEGTAVDAA